MKINRPTDVTTCEMSKLDMVKLLREFAKTILPSVEVNGTTYHAGMPNLIELKRYVEDYTGM